MSQSNWLEERYCCFRRVSFFLSLSFCFSPLYGERWHLLRSVVLFDETAASLSVVVVDEGNQRPLYLLLSSTKENGELCFFPLLGERRHLSRSVALFNDKATSLSVAVVEERKRWSLSLFLSSPRRKTESSLSCESKCEDLLISIFVWIFQLCMSLILVLRTDRE